MNWKILAVIIIAIAIVISGLFSSGTDFLKNIKESLGNLVSQITAQQNITADISLSASLIAKKGGIEFKNPISSIIMEFGENELFIGDEKFVFNGTSSMIINNFIGEINYNFSGQVSLNGRGETIFVSDIGILPHEEKTVSIVGDINVGSFKAYNTTLEKVSFISSGNLSVEKNKFSAKPENELVELINYKGDIEISGHELELEGLAKRIAIYGKNKLILE